VNTDDSCIGFVSLSALLCLSLHTGNPSLFLASLDSGHNRRVENICQGSGKWFLEERMSELSAYHVLAFWNKAAANRKKTKANQKQNTNCFL